MLAQAEAMRNDYKAQYPSYSDEQINNMVAGKMFNLSMRSSNIYTLETIPSNMATNYGKNNTFLIADYAPYRARGEELIRHQWNYLASLMPFTIPEGMTYDSYRRCFKADMYNWAENGDNPQNSILYWMNYNYVGNANARLAGKAQSEMVFHYLLPEDEERLNRVMREIDPYFTPINTANSDWRKYQEQLHGPSGVDNPAPYVSEQPRVNQPAPKPGLSLPQQNTPQNPPPKNDPVADFFWDLGKELLMQGLQELFK